ncbi:MAG: T9SS type A sorting domain-containing protein [Bacteroidota bacterium]
MKIIFKTSLFLGLILSMAYGMQGQISPGGYLYSNTIIDSLSIPVRIAIDNADNIYVTDALQKKIKKFNAAGNYIGSIVTGGSPVSIAINGVNQIFFGDGVTGKISKINSNGTISELYAGAVFPTSMVFCSDGFLYVSDSKLQRIIVLDMSGNVVRTIGVGTLTFPTGITFDKKNNRILVAEHGGIGAGFNPVEKVWIFGLTGNLITSFGSHGNGDGKFYRIQGVAVGRCGEIYVPEPYQGNVSVFTENTVFATRFGNYGDSLSELRIPLDIAINSQDQIFITAENNGAIEVFNIAYSLPTANISCGNKTICAGSIAEIPVHFTGVPPWSFTYAINGANAVTVSNTVNNPYIIFVSSPGNYEVTALSDSSHTGTCFSGNAIVTVDSVIPTAAIITENAAFCPGQSATISINLTGTPPWTFTYANNGINPQTVSNAAESPFFLNVSEAGNYSITALSGKGCPSSNFSGNSVVSQHPMPTAAITTGNASLCAGDSISLAVDFTGIAPWSFTFTINDANPVTISNIIANPYQLTVSQGGKYKITEVQDAFCISSVSSGSPEITINALPTADISSGNASICRGDSSNIIVDFTGIAPWNFTYTIDGANSVTLSGIASKHFAIPVTRGGTYQISAVSDAFCTGSPSGGTAAITVNPLPQVNLGLDVTIVSGDTLTLDAGPSFAKYLWSDGSAGQTMAVTIAGNYSVTARDFNGCSNSDSITVNVISIPANRDIQNVAVTGTDCFSAVQTITVAGGGTFFSVPNSGSATLIAGVSIICLPGTKIDSGGYFLGYITPDGVYCGMAPPPMVSLIKEETETLSTAINHAPENILKIYPNPSTGLVTIEITNPVKMNLRIDISDMTGRGIFSAIRNNPHVFEQLDLGKFPAGFYVVRLTSGNVVRTSKLVLID